MSDIDQYQLGQRLRVYRNRAGLSLKQAGRLVWVSAECVKEHESGRRRPTIFECMRYVKAYKINDLGRLLE